MRRLAGLFALVTLGTSTLAYADPPMNPQAAQHLKVGLDHFAHKEYDLAIDEFKQGYAQDPATDILYAWAQAERLRGDCPGAIKLYNKYLGQKLTPEQTRLATDNLSKCTKALEGQQEPPPDENPKPPVVEPQHPIPPPITQPPVEKSSAWYADPLGDALVIAGVAGLTVGVLEFLASNSAQDSANSATTYGDYSTNIQSAQSKRTIAILGLSAGAVLVVGGIVRYVTRSKRSSAPEVSAWVDHGSGGLVVFGRF